MIAGEIWEHRSRIAKDVDVCFIIRIDTNVDYPINYALSMYDDSEYNLTSFCNMDDMEGYTLVTDIFVKY